ncbi:MAG: hypothetical protein U9Q06_03825 [Nanoarchaeota archaeon]|nr:hypothetical protein [Nanoarchaeota archaeon]
MVSKQEYIEGFKLLPIENPTIDDSGVRVLFPHLTDDEVRAVLQPKKGSSKDVAIPSLKVNGGFQILSFNPKWKDERDGNVRLGKLSWSYAGRTKESYEDGRSHSGVFDDYAHMDKAIAFARENWGSDLVLDNWVDFITIHLDDPSQVRENGYPTSVGNVYFTTNRAWNDLINDPTKPESQLIDDAIVEMTTSPLVSHELKGGRGRYTKFNCGYCASGLGLSGCGGCDYTFKDDQYRNGWNTPIPSKLVQLLTSEGFEFKKDPQIAFQREQTRFEEM